MGSEPCIRTTYGVVGISEEFHAHETGSTSALWCAGAKKFDQLGPIWAACTTRASVCSMCSVSVHTTTPRCRPKDVMLEAACSKQVHYSARECFLTPRGWWADTAVL